MAATSASSSVRSLRFVITASRGLGRGLARCLVQRGHRVYLLDKDEDELKHTLTQHLPRHATGPSSTRSGPAFGGARCDVSSAEQVRAALAKASAHFGGDGRYDCVVNMAARTDVFQFAPSSPTEPGLLSEDALDRWRASLETNLHGAFLVARESVQYLRSEPAGLGREKDASEWGSIINISSTRSLQSEPNSEGYAST